MTSTTISHLPRARLTHAGGADIFTGAEHGDVPVSMFLVDAPPGEGPQLHRHPYPEVFAIHSGQALFQVDDEEVRATAGDVVIAPAGCAHRFTAAGEDNLQLTAIHAAPRMQTEWLTSD
jgi:quercetin dioxygenase-like cupin family protein